MDQAKKKKRKGDATSKKGFTGKRRELFFFFFLSRFQAQTLNVAWSGPSYEFIASVSMVISPGLKRVTLVTQETLALDSTDPCLTTFLASQ